MASKAKQLSKTQAEAAVVKNAPEYRLYVAAQTERKDATTDKARKAAERKMNSHRPGYTAYRNAYRRFKDLGGTLRKASTGKPTPAAKKNSGKGKGSKAVKSTTLSKSAMERRTKDNPLGLTDAQLKAEADGAPLEQPIGEVISSS